MKKHTLRLLLLSTVLFSLVAWRLWSNENVSKSAPIETSEIYWIAHALGGINGHSYTNSIDAFELNYANGFRVFEIDLFLTADEQICAAHTMESMRSEFGVDASVSEMTRKDFLSQRYFGSYKPVCLNEIEGLIRSYPDTTFIFDIKDRKQNERDPGAFSKHYRRIYLQIADSWSQHPDLWSRVIPQIYSESHLTFLESIHPFKAVLYTLYRNNASDEQVIEFVSLHPEIYAIATDRTRFNSSLAKNLRALNRMTLVHTINNPSEIQALSRNGASGFFTDFYTSKHLAPTEKDL